MSDSLAANTLEQTYNIRGIGKGFGYDELGNMSRCNVGEKVYDLWEEEEKSGDNRERDDEKREENGELAGRYCYKRRLVAGNGRGKGRRLAFDTFKGDEAHGGVRRADLFRKTYKRNRRIQKRDRRRRGDGRNETRRYKAKVSESNDPAGKYS